MTGFSSNYEELITQRVASNQGYIARYSFQHRNLPTKETMVGEKAVSSPKAGEIREWEQTHETN